MQLPAKTHRAPAVRCFAPLMKISTVTRLTLLAINAIVLVCAHCSVIVAPLRILCIGDSITEGGVLGRPEFTYRLPLQELLSSARIEAEFVGTQQHGLQPQAAWPEGFDPHHEGYYGATTEQVQRKLHQALPHISPADVALVLLGWNDLSSPFVFFNPLHALVKDLTHHNSRIIVLVGQLPNMGLRSAYLRFLVRQAVRDLNSKEAPVIAVEVFTDWDAKADTFDGVHPNVQGQQKLAKAWFEALHDHVNLAGEASKIPNGTTIR
jgi:acyl-CoA thioesterase-1